MTRRSHYRNAYQTFAKLLELGVLPIVNENDTVATTEIRFGDNDRLAALVAHLVHADLLVLLSDVDGLYDGRPGRTPGSTPDHRRGRRGRPRRRPRSAAPAPPGVGTGGMQTKVEAARIATGAGIPVVLTAADQAAAALAGEPVGTLFHATGRRRPTRLLWLAHATEPQGHAGARRRRGPRGRRAPGLAARRRAHRRHRQLRRRRPGRPRRPRRRRRSPAAWSTSTPTSCPPCSGAPRTTSSASSARRTSARSCTATTSSCSDADPSLVHVGPVVSDACASGRRVLAVASVLLLAPALVLTTARLVEPDGVRWSGSSRSRRWPSRRTPSLCSAVLLVALARRAGQVGAARAARGRRPGRPGAARLRGSRRWCSGANPPPRRRRRARSPCMTANLTTRRGRRRRAGADGQRGGRRRAGRRGDHPGRARPDGAGRPRRPLPAPRRRARRQEPSGTMVFAQRPRSAGRRRLPTRVRLLAR